MNDTVTAALPLQRWQGQRGTYHLVQITKEPAEAIATHATLRRMEFGRQRGFGSVKVIAQIDDVRWTTSVFPMKLENASKRSEKSWTLLVSKKVMRACDLAEGDRVNLTLELL